MRQHFPKQVSGTPRIYCNKTHNHNGNITYYNSYLSPNFSYHKQPQTTFLLFSSDLKVIYMILQIFNLKKTRSYSLITLRKYILSHQFILKITNAITVQVTEKFGEE